MKRQPDYTRMDAFSAAERALWRFLRDQGGYWNAAEALKFHPSFGTSHAVGGAMTRLHNNGHLVRRRTTTTYRYGVTSKCRPPAGETMTPEAIEAEAA